MPPLDAPLASLGLPEQIVAALAAHGIGVVGDVLAHSDKEMVTLRIGGWRAVRALKLALIERGYLDAAVLADFLALEASRNYQSWGEASYRFIAQLAQFVDHERRLTLLPEHALLVLLRLGRLGAAPAEYEVAAEQLLTERLLLPLAAPPAEGPANGHTPDYLDFHLAHMDETLQAVMLAIRARRPQDSDPSLFYLLLMRALLAASEGCRQALTVAGLDVAAIQRRLDVLA